METNRVRHKEQRERAKTDPAQIYWRALVERVHASPDGFSRLPEAEKKYYAVCSVDGEIYNGGLQQFFENQSGTCYREALAGLEDMGATFTLELMKRAKQILFAFRDVPEDTAERRRLLSNTASPSREARMGELDTLFCEDPDGLAERIQQFAREQKLF